MAEAIVYGIAQEVLKNLGSRALNDVASAWVFKEQLKKLKNTINTIKNVLLDAEEKQVHSHVVRGWLERLTEAMYVADDLFDELATVAALKQLKGRSKMTKELRTFFSRSNQIAFAFSISKKIREIREEIDDIAKDGTQFNFVVRSVEEVGIVTRKKETSYSFVDDKEVIGRDGDQKIILDLLLASSSTNVEELPVFPIVGIGGMGKTALAQLIYNDPSVEDFFELKLWVCVSDDFDIKVITEKILMSATNAETQKLEMEQLQGQLRKEVSDKKYLLVLDDVWNEKRVEWLKLRELLTSGKKGSKILVTTRSREVANIMGTFPPYELGGLSEDKAWALFEKMALTPEEAKKKPHLVKIGKEIVKKCANVPLAIRIVGSLLYGKNESKWLAFKSSSFANVHLSDNGNDIMNILEYSYQHLSPPLKNCFAYCSLFPKDYEFDKETLISLWMAEGFITPVYESQSLEELGEDYFCNLLQRCFFQDTKTDLWGAIVSCKMHDLIHDFAQVVGFKCKIAKLGEGRLSEKIRHLSIDYRLDQLQNFPSCIQNLKLLRTFLLPKQMHNDFIFENSLCNQLLLSFNFLRVLDLHHVGVITLPSSVGKLIHLRYLDLSGTQIEELPNSITELLNLQTLNLHSCWKFKELPANIRKLTNLRSLSVGLQVYLEQITHLPSGIGELTSLHKLPLFIVNHKNPGDSRFKPSDTAKLSDLKKLDSLTGNLRIRIHRDFETVALEPREAILSSKYGLSELDINFDFGIDESGMCSQHDEVVLEGLKPHSNLKKLTMYRYQGKKLPSWAIADTFCINLPNLVEIEISSCRCCSELPPFSQLHYLKRLTLYGLESVEYVESSNGRCDLSTPSSSSQPMLTLFFPSLEELKLSCMTNLKGWWKEAVEAPVGNNLQNLPTVSFCNLSKLSIASCLLLIFQPLCPKVEELELTGNNDNLSVLKFATSSGSESFLKLKKLTTNNVEELVSIPKQCLHQLSSLDVINDDKVVTSDGDVAEVFEALSSSLRSLRFISCKNLKSVSNGLEHLTTLEDLSLMFCELLDLPSNEQPWKAFNSGNLRSLKLTSLAKLESLPSGLQHLSNLRSLEISFNRELVELPQWISCFSSLKFLDIRDCPKLTYLPEGFNKLTTLNQLRIIDCEGLTARCKRPYGVDWPKIQHIPLVSVIVSAFDSIRIPM